MAVSCPPVCVSASLTARLLELSPFVPYMTRDLLTRVSVAAGRGKRGGAKLSLDFQITLNALHMLPIL